jgi:hypothetical protein
MAALKSELFLEFVILALSVGLWFAAAPASLSRDLPPAELIEKALPAKMTIEGAGKPDLLSAVCAAVRKHRKSGVGVTTAAVAARGEFSGDIVGAVLRCAGTTDCKYVGAIVKAAVSVRPGAATTISDVAMARAPNCEEPVQAAVRAAAQIEDERVKTDSPNPAEESPSIGKSADPEEKFDPHERLVLVCDGGMQRAVRESLLADFLRLHAKAAVGSCPATPSPSLAPSPPAARP